MYNITIFKNVFQYQMAKFNNAKPQLLLHQTNRGTARGRSYMGTPCTISSVFSKLNTALEKVS